jgi:hypothetical protein
MRVAILCNGKNLALWQRRAVEKIADGHELFVLGCSDPPRPPRSLRHAAYYALNLVTIRNRLTKRVAFPDPAVSIAGRFDCTPGYDGNWAILPGEALAWLKAQRIDAVVKFGLGLLRVPDKATLATPILSYHHGDPCAFRGRPAGFWELIQGAPLVGQVVQILSNQLDAGKVVAFGESRAIAHSYRRTLVEAYSLSPHLLPSALRALERGETLPLAPTGRNHRLPDTQTVLRFIAARVAARFAWLAYGAFVSKQWNVAIARASGGRDPITALRAADEQGWKSPALTPPYSFFADPFFDPQSEGLFVEALNRWSGKGELARLTGDRVESLGHIGGHTSYPAVISEAGKDYVVPEISEWSNAGIYSLDAGRLSRVADLDIEVPRLIDPTLFRHDGALYLFANSLEDGVNVLHLWTAPGLFERFERHPLSPICLSVRGSRMAGHVARFGDALYRLGQDGQRGYGDGLRAFRILALSPSDYREEAAGEMRFSKVHGPHTLNFRNGDMVFDYYLERVSLLAGIRRAASKF